MPLVNKEVLEKASEEKIKDSGLKQINQVKAKQPKDVYITFKLNRQDKQLFEGYAEVRGSTISNEARRLVLDLLIKQGLK